MRDADDAFVNVIAQMNRHKTVQQALHDVGLKHHPQFCKTHVYLLLLT